MASPAHAPQHPVRVVVMGVSGSGKSTVGAQLAAALAVPFVDGDDLHPADNVAKMSAGHALDDADRAPWLRRIRDALAANDGMVIACSALRRSYRDVLRSAGGVRFVHLELARAVAEERVRQRPGHFMGTSMVASQFATLEPPGPDEPDVVVLDASTPVDDLVQRAVDALDRPSAS